MKAVNTRAVRFGRADQGYAMALTLYRPKKKDGCIVRSTDADVRGNRKYGQWPLRRYIATNAKENNVIEKFRDMLHTCKLYEK